MSKDFNIRRDWKKIQWKETIQYFSLRAVASGIVWFVIVGLTQNLWVWWFLLFAPLIIIGFVLPLVLFTSWLSRLGVPYIGLVSILFTPVIIFGDPLVWALSRIRPDLVPINDPPFMTTGTLIFVLLDEDALEPCPVAGRILSDENIEFLGYVYPLRKTLFIIGEDWSVATLYDDHFGFIDMEGSIKKGRLQQGIDPRETNIGEMVAYIVSDKTCYDLHQQRIGAHESVPYTETVKPESDKSELEQYAEKLTEIESVRKLKRSDFPQGQALSDFAGEVRALKDLSFMGSEWDKDETLFEITLLGEVRTPYDSNFGCVEGTGEIVQEDNDTMVAKIMGKYCYAGNEKIGQFVPQEE